MIHHIASRYGRGLEIPSAAAIARFGWGWTPLQFVVRAEKPADDPDVWREIPRPRFVSSCDALKARMCPAARPVVVDAPVRKRVARAGPPEQWEDRRAEYLARKATA